MFFNQIAQRARDDIMDALRVRQMGQPNVQGLGVKPQQPPMQPGALPQATMPPTGMPQAQMAGGFPQAPYLPQPPQMPAMPGLGNAYGMGGALPIAQRPQGAPAPVRFARGGLAELDEGTLTPEERNMLEYSRDHYRHGTFRQNPDASITSFKGMIVGGPEDGGYRVIPSYWDGHDLSPEDAERRAAESGIHFPVFPDLDQAEKAEAEVHRFMDADVKALRRGKKFADGGYIDLFRVR